MFFFKPDVYKLKKAGSVNGLIKALRYKKDCVVRSSAAEYLGQLGATKAIPPLLERLLADEDPLVQGKCAGSLRQLNYAPQKDAGGAKYWNALNNYKQCAECGVEHALPLLLRTFVGLGESDGHFYDECREAYLSLGPAGFEPFVMLTEQIYAQYKSFVSGISGLNYMHDGDKRKAAIIKHFSRKLSEATRVIAGYGVVPAAVYCIQVYGRVKKEIYSVPASKFDDIFDAEAIRQHIVDCFATFKDIGFDQIDEFLADVLADDPSYLVRWAAVDVLRVWPKQRVQQSVVLQRGLRAALEREPDSVSSRKKHIKAMFNA